MVVASIGEILFRLSPANNESFISENNLSLYVGGSEYNVLTYLSQFGLNTKFFSVVPNNKLGDKIIDNMHSFNINSEHMIFNGSKVGMYFALESNESKPQEVLYDREYSSFYNFNFDISKIYELLENVDILHLSGITPALSSKHESFILETIKLAKEQNILISYDSNFRSKLWSQQAAGAFLEKCLPFVDIAFLGILDLQFLLNYDVSNLEDGYKKLSTVYPNLKYIASTNRNVISPIKHELSTNIYFANELFTSRTISMNVVDRIGSGDAFTAGILYGIVNNDSIEDIANFALSNAVLKHYIKGDNYKLCLQDVLNYKNGSTNKIDR